MLNRAKLPLSFAAVLAIVFAVQVFAQEAQVDDEGFIRNWLILAPLPMEASGAEDIDKEQIKDEANIQPKEGDKQKVGDKEVVWKAVKTTDYFFDVCEIIGAPGETGIAYAVAYVVAPEEMKDVDVAMGSNDQGRLYVNGKEAVKAIEGRTLDKDQDTGKGITLKKGVNVVVFKVINESNNWQGCVRFKKGEEPIKNLKVQTKP